MGWTRRRCVEVVEEGILLRSSCARALRYPRASSMLCFAVIIRFDIACPRISMPLPSFPRPEKSPNAFFNLVCFTALAALDHNEFLQGMIIRSLKLIKHHFSISNVTCVTKTMLSVRKSLSVSDSYLATAMLPRFRASSSVKSNEHHSTI